MGESLTVLLWNVMWRRRGNGAGDRVAELIGQANADLICLTEAFVDLLPSGGHVLASALDYGYGPKEGRHKVVLWSRLPWTDTDRLGNDKLPAGRFVSGRTTTPLGPLTVYGVCIPWNMAGVRRPEAPLRAWEAHLAFLNGLDALLPPDMPGDSLILGDFNQHLPRRRAPIAVHERLRTVIGERLTIATAGVLEGFDAPVIDHLAHGNQLRLSEATPISPVGPAGEKLSDHVGLRLILSRV